MVYGNHGLLFKPVFKVFYNFTFYCSFNNDFFFLKMFFLIHFCNIDWHAMQGMNVFAILFVIYLCNILDY